MTATVEPSTDSSRRLAQYQAEQNRLNATVATPPGTDWMSDNWELEKDGTYTRMAFGPTHHVALTGGHTFAVGADAVQDGEGRTSKGCLYVHVSHDGPMSLAQADELIAAIQLAREDLARMTQ